MNSKDITSPEPVSAKNNFQELIFEIKGSYKFLMTKWVIILCFSILGCILGFGFASFRDSLYVASTTFVLEEDKQGGGLSSLAGLASMAGVELGGGGNIFQGDNIIELYKSRKMIEKTLLSPINQDEDELIIDRFISSNRLRDEWSENKELENIKFSPNQGPNRLKDSIISSIVKIIGSKYLSVTKPDKKLSIIEVVVKSPDELLAQKFNEQIVKNVNDFYVQTKTKKSLENVSILQSKTDSIRGVMNGSIYTAAAVLDATPNINPTRQAQRSAPVQRSQFSAETNKMILGELVKNLEMSKISLRRETPLIQVIDSPTLPLNIDKLSKLKAMILCGFLFAFLTILFFLSKRIYIKAINE